MILDQVIAIIRRHRMLAPRDRVVVGVSGGPDSVALLHLLLELRPSFELGLTVAHLDHGLRGAGSDADRAYVEEMARRLELPCVARREDVGALARRERRSPEEAGRIARRRFLREVAEATGSRRVALGHHRDDQAETVLLSLVGGAGRGGLAGIRPVSEGLFIRPLLEIPRAEILAYLDGRGLVPRVDASNADRRFPRNRIRHDVLPILRESLNPRAVEAIAGTAEILRAEDDYLDRRARRALEALLAGSEGGAPAAAGGSAGSPSPLILDAVRLRRLPVPLARRVLRLALRRAGLRGRDLARGRIEEILELASRGENRALSLGEALTARLEYGRLHIEQGARRAMPAGAAGAASAVRTLGLPGEAAVAEAGVVVRARLAPRESVESEYRRAPAHRIYVDAATLEAPMTVRAPRPGDRLHPLGAPGSRKLSDLWTDLKVGREARRRGLVVESAGRIVWAVGLRLADPFRITDTTREVAILEAIELSRPADRPYGAPAPEAPARADLSRTPRTRAQESSGTAPLPQVLYTAVEIHAAIERLAGEVASWAAGREILVLGVLQGSFIFLADLVRLLPGPLRIGFLDREGTPIPPFPSLVGARVLLVEDILDTGESLVRILERLRAGAPEELRTCILFDKPAGRRTAIEADWTGLHVPDRWVVGYGLDADGKDRNLPYLTWV